VKRIAVLGSTGTIGHNTLELVRAFPEKFEVVALGAGRNLGLLREQIRAFRPAFVTVQEQVDRDTLAREFPELELGWGGEGLETAVSDARVDVVVVGIVGFAALAPTLRAIRARKTVALANKESLVVAGSLLRQEVATSGATVIPVDSEHNALYQLLQGRPPGEVDTLVLTASGGPLLRRPELPLAEVTPEIATRHPNWKMGPKISVDSATLMNKGLELIEAHFLFDVPSTRIEVWVHPQSIVHGAIWLTDNSCLAQLSKPDMRSSIGYAMAYPERLAAPIPRLGLSEMARLEFLEPDLVRFPALGLAREALEAGPSSLVALNAANEVAVEAFLNGRILFPDIPATLSEVLEGHQSLTVSSLDTVFQLDSDARREAERVVAKRRK
jgi:1-deoxy-D-xylulose-5-phosphate reductoisomerase